MKKLNEEQIEDVLCGRLSLEEDEDIDSESKAKLKLHGAVRDRLRKAAAQIEPPSTLDEKIRLQLRESEPGTEGERKSPVFSGTLYRFGVFAVAASILVIAGLFVFSPGRASAQSTLAGIHHDTVSREGDFVTSDNPEDICSRLAGKCASCIKLPELSCGCKYAGSRIARFRGHNIAAVLVEVPDGYVTVLSVPDSLASLHFGKIVDRNGRRCSHCDHEDCKIEAVEVKDHTYIAIGAVSRDILVKLLDRLVKTH